MLSFSALIHNYFKPINKTNEATQSGVVLNTCKFCNVSTGNGFTMMWEDEKFAAFLDHKPASLHHAQVIPKTHISSVKALRKSDTDLVRSMEEIGHRLLDDLGVSPSMRKMGFHIPPFNSVDHLHLHVQGLPYNSITREAKYPVVPGCDFHHKGFSWFVEVGQAVQILEQGGRVVVFPC